MVSTSDHYCDSTRAAELLTAAKQLHRTGCFHEAEISYRKTLAIEPDYFEALHLRGILNAQLGRYDISLDLLEKAIALKPEHANARSNLGNVQKALGNYANAFDSYRRSIELEPGNADSWSNLGCILSETGELSEAEKCLRKSLELNPGHADAWSNLGNVMISAGKQDEAEHCYKQAIKVNPIHVNAILNLAICLQKRGDLVTAESCLNTLIASGRNNEEVLSLLAGIMSETGRVKEAQTLMEQARDICPNSVQAYLSLSKILWDTNQLEKSEQCLRQLLQIDPDHVDALNNLGALLKETGHAHESIQFLRKAIEIDPENVDALCNLGNTLADLEQQDEAIRMLEYAIKIDPGHAVSWANLATQYWESGDLEKAEQYFQKSIELNSDYADAHANLGMVLLSQGNFREGWCEYEWRWKKRELQNKMRHFEQPLWQGEDLTDKSLFIYPEQGYGDLIQFIRYIIPLSERAGRLYIEIPAKIKRLLGCMHEYVELVTPDKPPSQFDYQCPLLSLPHRLETDLESIPDYVPYLHAEAESSSYWKQRLGQGEYKNVGIAWQGNTAHKRDHIRSISLHYFRPLLELEGVRFISLQKGEGEEQIGQFGFVDQIVSFSDELDVGNDAFVDTAALIANLDLIITCDTSIVHLAGAMAKPVWLMLSHVADFRWLRDREDSPWYPGVRLFRQREKGNWDEPVQTLKRALQEMIDGKTDTGHAGF